MQTSDLLHFDEEKHLYTLNGVAIPNVTSILNPLTNYEGIPKSILDEASERGKAVHRACELHDLGKLDYSSVDDVTMGYLMGWIKFLDDHKPQIIEVETRVFHKTLKYAGTIDRLLIMKNVLGIWDIKTTAQYVPTVREQTAAYKEAKNSWGDKVIERGVIYLDRDGNYEKKKCDDKSDFNSFVGLLNLYRRREMYYNKPTK